MRFCYCQFGVLFAALLSQPAHAQAGAPTASSAVSASADPAQASATAAFAAVSANPQVTGPGLTLGQAIERFRSENLRLVAAEYELGAARADVIAAGLLPNPRLSLATELRIHGEPDSADRQYSVQVSQTLPIWGRLGANRDAARLTATAAERSFAAVGWQLLGDLRSAYLGLQLATERQAVLTNGLNDLERVEHVLSARAAAGANPAYDELRLSVERENLRARIAEAEVSVSEARADLAGAIGGTPLETELSAADPLSDPTPESRDTSTLVRRAIAHRHEIAAVRLESAAADARLRAVRRRFIPEPELGLGYASWSGIPGAPAGSSGGALLASASIPLPLFDRGQGTIERQREQGRAAKVRESDLRNAIEREVLRKVRTLRLTHAAYLGYREAAGRSAESVRRIAELTYREGRGTILELLDAYSSYLRVEEQALELRGAALSASLSLEQAVGP